MGQISRHTFSHLDVDTEISAQPSNSFQAATNIALEPGYVTPVRGNVAVPYALPATGTNRRLGGFEDGATGTVVSLLYNSAGAHRLIRYDPVSGTETTLLEWAGLRLSADLVVQGGVVDGLLVFLDGRGELRRVDLARAAAGDYAPSVLAADPYALHLVPQPPRSAPTSTRETNATAADPRSLSNNVADKAWQFAFQYQYVDGVFTPPGPYSDVALIARTLYGNPVPDPRNFLRIPYPATPPPLVKKLRLLVRAQGEAEWSVAGDMTPGTPYDFYGTTTGEVLPTAVRAKLAEAIPVRVGAVVVAHSRVIAGDCTEGYAPSLPLAALSASAGPQASTAGTPLTVYRTDTRYLYTYTGGDGNDRTDYAQRLVSWRLIGGAYPDPASSYQKVQLILGQYYPDGDTAIYSYQQAFVDYAPDEVDGGSLRTVTLVSGTLAAGSAAPDTEATLHENSVYPVGVAYYDALGRTAGAEAVRSVAVPRQDYLAPAAQNVRWALDAAATPPAWAVSYQLLLGRSLTSSYFLQLKAALKQFRGDNADGSPDVRPFDENGYDAVKAVWVSLAALPTQGQGYAFSAGDRLRFPALSPAGSMANTVDYPILYERDGYVAIPALALRLFRTPALTAINTTPTDAYTHLVELYTPAPALETTTLYERGPRYAITDPGTPAAAHATLSGVLVGDAVFMSGQVNNTGYEAMNPSAADYELWLDAGRGRPVPRNPDGQSVRRKDLIRFSGVKVQGDLLNGLSEWDALNQTDDTPQELGAITRLAVADQTQADGSLLLVTQERGEGTLPLGRSQIQTADGEPLLAISKQVLGPYNTLRGGWGCTDPAALVPYAGKVFYYCARRTEWLRYDRNGLTPLALTYKARTRLAAVAKQYAGARVSAAYHPAPARRELWLTFGPVGELPGRTLVYSDLHEAWADEVSAVPEAALGVGAELLSWQNGHLWRHTQDAPACSFFGVTTPATLTFAVAQPAGAARQFKDVAVESASLWLPTDLQTDTGLESRTLGHWFVNREGVFRAGLRRAINGPGTSYATIFSALDNGLPLIGTRLSVTLTAPDNASPLTAVSVSWTPRSGQTMGV